MPSAVCPIPTAHTPQDALKAYLDAKKSMPGLTPAAWRKAAAHSMGLDYNTYLALWKVHKGVASRLKVVPASTPTVPAAASQTVTMGIKAAPKGFGTANVQQFVFFADELEDIVSKANKGLYTFDQVNDLVDFIEDKVKLSNLMQSSKDKLIAKAATVKKAFPKTATQKAIDQTVWRPKFASSADNIDDIMAAYNAGKIAADDAIKFIKQVSAGKGPGIVKMAENKIAQLSSKADDVVDAAGVIQTAHGPLTHDLAQSVYKKMKKDMPNGSPAVWRHAAAEYLGVDYNDYLKAWKKTTTAAQKAAQTPASKLPPNTNVPLSPSSAGKYANEDITIDGLKTELAKAYGPGAQKQYINLTYLDHVGKYQVAFPKSLLPTEAAKEAVVKQLKALGLHVEKDGSYYYIWSGKAAQTAAKNAASIKTTGTYTLPNGYKVWDFDAAKQWSHKWWRTLTADQRRAVESYTGSGYAGLNSWLRGKTSSLWGGEKFRDDLSAAMRPIEHEITVFRGTHISLSEFKVGGLWRDKGFMSTAINPGSAWQGTKFEIVCPKGTRGAYVDPYSSHRGENEFLIDRNTQFRVVGIVGNVVKLVAIPKK